MSAGNHAIAVAYAARLLGTTAKVVMPRTASPARVQLARDQGATVELVENVHGAAARVKEIESEERRTFVHPFEGPGMALGAATVGLELADHTIADSLGAPFAAPFSFGLCRANVDAVVKVTDDQPRAAMRLLFSSAKLAVEPAGAVDRWPARRSPAGSSRRKARGAAGFPAPTSTPRATPGT